MPEYNSSSAVDLNENDDYELDDEPLSLDELEYYANRNEPEEFVPFDDYSIPDEHYENSYSRYRYEEEYSEPEIQLKSSGQNKESVLSETKQPEEFKPANELPQIVNETHKKTVHMEQQSKNQQVPKVQPHTIQEYPQTPEPTAYETAPEKTPTVDYNSQSAVQPQTESVQANEVQQPNNNQPTARQQEQPNTAVIFGNTAYSKIPDKQHITSIDPTISVNLFNRLQQDNIGFSGKFADNNLTVVCSKNNVQRAKNIIREETERLAERSEPELVPRTEKHMPEEEKATEIKTENKPVKAEPFSESELSSMNIGEKANVLIASLKDRQEKKRADLLDKLDRIDGKIADRQERINKLTDKISDIETSLKTSAALKRVFGNTALGGLIDRSIEKKQAKIREIRDVKIPKHEGKIQAHSDKKAKVTGKLEKVNRKIGKLDKVQDFISALGSKDKERQHKGFVSGLESLSDIRRENLENKLNKNQTKIDMLSARLSSPELSNMDRLQLNREIRILKTKSSDISDKIKGLVKLHGDLDDMKNGRFTEREIETAVNITADKISESLDDNVSPEDKGIVNHIISQTAQSGNEAVSEVSAEKSAIQTEKAKPHLDRERIPEKREPEVTENTEQKIMTAVAAVTGIAVSELNRLPAEIKADIIAEFRENNGNIPAEKLSERLCSIADIEPPKAVEIREVFSSNPAEQAKKESSAKQLEEISNLMKNFEKQTKSQPDKPLFSRSAIMSEKYSPTSAKDVEDIERDRQNKKHETVL